MIMMVMMMKTKSDWVELVAADGVSPQVTQLTAVYHTCIKLCPLCCAWPDKKDKYIDVSLNILLSFIAKLCVQNWLSWHLLALFIEYIGLRSLILFEHYVVYLSVNSAVYVMC